MSWISWLIIGAFSGWVGSKIMGVDEKMGSIANILSGIVGGMGLNAILAHFGIVGINGFFEIESWLTSIVGAVILIAAVKCLKNRS